MLIGEICELHPPPFPIEMGQIFSRCYTIIHSWSNRSSESPVSHKAQGQDQPIHWQMTTSSPQPLSEYDNYGDSLSSPLPPSQIDAQSHGQEQAEPSMFYAPRPVYLNVIGVMNDPSTLDSPHSGVESTQVTLFLVFQHSSDYLSGLTSQTRAPRLVIRFPATLRMERVIPVFFPSPKTILFPP